MTATPTASAAPQARRAVPRAAREPSRKVRRLVALIVRCPSPGGQPTRPEQRLLHGQVVLVGEIGLLLAADDRGHVGGVGDVALVLAEGDFLIALPVLAAGRAEGHPGGGPVEGLEVEGPLAPTDDQVPAGDPLDLQGAGPDGGAGPG